MSNAHGMWFKQFRLFVNTLPVDKPRDIEPPWPIYDKVRVYLTIPELPGGDKPFPVRGFDMRHATQPKDKMMVISSAPLAWFDEATARDIGVIMARWRKENEAPPVTPDDVNRMLAEASGK